MNKEDFHIPFLHSMILIGAVTLVSVFSSRFFVERYYFSHNKSLEFTSAPLSINDK